MQSIYSHPGDKVSYCYQLAFEVGSSSPILQVTKEPTYPRGEAIAHTAPAFPKLNLKPICL